LKEDHGFQMSFEEFQFESMDEFEAWKKNVEQESNVRFVKVTGQKKLATSVCIFYECHRSGSIRPQPNAEEVNSSKLNRRCLAQIRLIKTDNKHLVQFHRDHSHGIELEKCPISQKAQESVVAMLKAGYAKEYIL
jgi:hypothetical protein